jgi:hypothetical protein
MFSSDMLYITEEQLQFIIFFGGLLVLFILTSALTTIFNELMESRRVKVKVKNDRNTPR